MRATWIAVLTLLAATGARADEAARMVAHFTRTDAAAVSDGQGFALPRGAGFNRIAVARRLVGEHTIVGAAVLLRCGRMCAGTPIRLSPADRVAVLGVIDLDGAAVALPTEPTPPTRTTPWAPVGLIGRGGRPRWPALVLRTERAEVGTATTRTYEQVVGTAVTTRLVLVSLRARDRGRVVFDEPLQDTGANGAGIIRTFALTRTAPRGRLTIAATEQRRGDRTSACLPPPPIAYTYRWVDDRYRRDDGPLAATPCH